MRLLALLGVIVIHAGSVAYVNSGAQYALIASYAGRYAIPVFFTVAALLQSRTMSNRTPGDHIKRRARRLLVPYVIWTAAYSVVGVLVEGGFEYGVKELTFFGGGYGYHLWFLVAVFLFDTVAVVIPSQGARMAVVAVLAVNTLGRHMGLWVLPIDEYLVSAVPWTDWLLLYFVVVVAGRHLGRAPGWVWAGVAVVLGAGGLAALWRVPAGEIGWAALAVHASVSALCMVGVVQSTGWRSPSGPVLAGWSELVLGMYILHYGVIKILIAAFEPPSGDLWGVVYLTCVIGVTILVTASAVHSWRLGIRRIEWLGGLT
jgi:surface polysaccharide O-acyltransferase-like enzyme